MFWFMFIRFFMISAISQVKCDTRKLTENLSNYVDNYNGTDDPRWSIIMENQGKTYRRIKPNDTDDFTVSYTDDRGASTVLRIRLSVQKVGGELETTAAGDGQLLGSTSGQRGPETAAAPNGTAATAGSTTAPNCTATTTGSTSPPNGTSTAAGSTFAANGTTIATGSTSAPNGTSTAAGSTSAPNGTVATTTPSPRPTDGGNSGVADDDDDDDDDMVANDPPRLARVASALPLSRNNVFDDDDDDGLVLVVENDIRLKLFFSPRAGAVPSLDFGSAGREDVANSPSPTTTPPPHPRSARSTM